VSSPLRRILPGLVALLVSLTLSLGLTELAVRWLAPQPQSWLSIYRRHPALPFHAFQPDARAEIETSETRWRVITDADGFRVGETRAEAGACTSLWLGDSFAFGHGVDFDESWVGLLQARAPAVRQVDSAVPGYGPVQYRAVFDWLLERGVRPDTAIVAIYVGNDFHDCVWDKDAPVNEGVLGHRRDLKSFLKTHLQLYRLATSVYHRLAPTEDEYRHVLAELADPEAWTREPLSVALATFEREMKELQVLAREHGVELRFLVIPTRDAVAAVRAGATATEGSTPLLPVEKAGRVLADLGADFLDATSPLARAGGEELYFPFDGHLTPEGNRIVADALLERWPEACRSGPDSP